MRARWLVALALAVLAAALLGGPASGAPPKKCPKSKVTRVVDGTKACVPAARFRARVKPPSPAASLVRESLTRTVPGLRQRPGRALPRTIPPRLARQIAARFPAVEAKLAADVRAARAQASTARSHAIAVTGTSISSSADGSSTTGRINMRAGEGGSAIDVAASLTATAAGQLDVGVNVSSRTASGSRLTKGITLRDVLAGETPKCPTGTGPLSVRGGVDATARTEEVFDSGRAKLGTVREASTVNVTSSARAGINPDGSLQPITVTVGVSVDHARSAQGLAFFQSRQRAVARGTMTATVDPTTGRVSNARVSSTGKASGFEGDAAAADAAFTRLAESLLNDEVGRLREKLVAAAKACAPGYTVTLALTTDAAFATHSASGTLNATLTAKRDGSGGSFTDSGSLDYGNLTFTSRLPDCSYTDPASIAGTWSVTIEPTPTGALKVTWVPGGGGGPRTTATMNCVDFSVPGQPGVTLAQPTPTTFELPSGGGQQAIEGGFQSGGDGFTNSGTLTITPLRR